MVCLIFLFFMKTVSVSAANNQVAFTKGKNGLIDDKSIGVKRKITLTGWVVLE